MELMLRDLAWRKKISDQPIHYLFTCHPGRTSCFKMASNQIVGFEMKVNVGGSIVDRQHFAGGNWKYATSHGCKVVKHWRCFQSFWCFKESKLSLSNSFYSSRKDKDEEQNMVYGELLGSNQHTRKHKRDEDVSLLLDKMERRKWRMLNQCRQRKKIKRVPGKWRVYCSLWIGIPCNLFREYIVIAGLFFLCWST